MLLVSEIILKKDKKQKVQVTDAQLMLVNVIGKGGAKNE